jgi:hypothetical protein
LLWGSFDGDVSGCVEVKIQRNVMVGLPSTTKPIPDFVLPAPFGRMRTFPKGCRIARDFAGALGQLL